MEVNEQRECDLKARSRSLSNAAGRPKAASGSAIASTSADRYEYRGILWARE
jgi:hypothetical protein